MAIMNIVSETSFVDFDFQVFITCGRNVVHDNAPAIIPTISLFISVALSDCTSFQASDADSR